MEKPNPVIGIIWTVIFVALGAFFQSMDSVLMKVISWFFFLLAGGSVMFMLKRD
jgi:hypothetical protein